MKKIPYNLYIHFDELSSFFKGNTNRKENFLICGFVSVELSTYLMGSILKTKEKNNRDKISHILQGIETQFKLLNSCDFILEEKGFKESYSKNIENLKLLDHSYSVVIDRITTSYFELSEKVKIGLDDQINKIRDYFFLVKLPVKRLDIADQIEYPNIIKELKLDELEYFNSEDEMFMITHQVSECWFNIAINELKTIDNIFENSAISDDKIGHHFKVVYETLLYLADNILLLEHMILADYHPLRVALRGASGGQSQQAYELFYISKKLFEKFLKHIESDNINIVQILENPNDNAVLLPIVNHFTNFERSLKNFFFQHYVLTSNIIGSQSFGSIGLDIVSLADKFVEPIFKEIDQAKYDLTLKTNYQYGNISGILILDKEGPTPENTEVHTTKIDAINTAVNGYFDAISSFDQEKWVDLFSENGYMEDPVGSRPYIGHQQLAIFFKGVIRFFSELSMTIESKHLEEDSVKIIWKAKAKSFNGKEILFNGIEVFKINNNGKIMSAQVEWDPSIIAKQL
jgi:steroid delta-isomerase